MMKLMEALDKLLKKYRISMPVDADTQKYILNNRKASLIKILKNKKDYNFLANLSISLSIFFRGLGIRIKPGREPIILASTAFAAACLIFFAVKSVLLEDVYKTPVLISENTLIVMLVSGDVRVDRKGKDAGDAKIRDEIYEGDRIITGRESMLMAQMGTKGIIYISSESSIDLINLNDKSEIFLKKGLLISRFPGNEKGGAYMVKTPNALAEVTGTEFSVSYENAESLIALGKGRLKITRLASKEHIMLMEGKTASVDDIIRVRGIKERESLEIKKISDMEIDLNLGNYSAGELESRMSLLLVKLKDIDREIQILLLGQNRFSPGKEKEMDKWMKLPPLERLRREGKILTMLYLRDGSKIAGSIYSQDERDLKLDTADGIIIIPKKDIIRRESLK